MLGVSFVYITRAKLTVVTSFPNGLEVRAGGFGDKVVSFDNKPLSRLR